jgi:hypothetical protein
MMSLASAKRSWIPGRASLARNDGRVVTVIPAQLVPSPYWGAGIQILINHKRYTLKLRW